MAPEETYKYLGFEQNTNINHSRLKQQLKDKYKHRLTLLLKSKLNSKNLFKAINTYAAPVIGYSFGIIRWSHTDIDELNRLNRTQLTRYRKLHPNSCIERITISRPEGGRGLVDFHTLYNSEIDNLRQYFHSKDTPLHRTITKADRRYTPLNLHEEHAQLERSHTITQKKEEWSRKTLHGKHYNIVQNPYIDQELTYKWLTMGQIYPETEGFILAIQDNVIATRNYRKFIIKEAIESDTCRKCHQTTENIDHITGSCKLLAGTDYTERHNAAAKIIHQELAHKHNLIQTKRVPYYTYLPDNVLENETHRLYWDRTIYTDKTVTSNRPDITLIDKVAKQTYIIDIAVPNDVNVIKKEQEKVTKYTPLAIELKEVWRQEVVNIIPLVISVTGITSKNFTRHLKTLDLNTYTHTNMQKAIILKTSSIVRKFLHQIQ
ncbi:uncharacterized protein LOC116163856 [Photinus pyralis]|uniref:uncharacterized protein LOC116163856 n=1 Tax=Photinus pyralis TaxID=7054 RepID=UPI001266F388|nr:uncharacterized protein LOC116163856 [Photinus pyralis]